MQSNKVTDLVVGYPLGMKGQKTDQTKKVDGFIEVLKNKANYIKENDIFYKNYCNSTL